MTFSIIAILSIFSLLDSLFIFSYGFYKENKLFKLVGINLIINFLVSTYLISLIF